MAALAWIAAAIAILPALFHWAEPHRASRSNLATWFSWLLAAAICTRIYRTETRRLNRSWAVVITLLILLFTLATNSIHYHFVDVGVPPSNLGNEQWQITLQDQVIQSHPGVIPHSYRFLPNAIVRWIELLHVSYPAARNIYRLLTGLLVFYAVFRYARLYTGALGGVLALLLTAAVYPVSFIEYLGQLTDPLSHLSFLLALIFLETDQFALFLTTVLIGALAKETVFCLFGYYLLFAPKTRPYWSRAALLLLTGGALYFGVRAWVLHGVMAYRSISNVMPEHILFNFKSKWFGLVLLTGLAYVPFLIAFWSETPRSLRRLSVYLLLVLLVSNLVFSWLNEPRNLMPAVFVLAVVAARGIVSLRDESP